MLFRSHFGQFSPRTCCNPPVCSRPFVHGACAVRISDGGASSVDGELRTLNKAGAIDRQKDDCVGCRRAARGRLGGQLLQTLPRRVGAFSAGGSGTHCIDTDNARTILSRRCFGQQIQGPRRSPAEGPILFAGGCTCKNHMTAGLGSPSREHFCRNLKL